MWRRRGAAPRERRRTNRRIVQWVGRYAVAGDADESWSPCVVLDASRGGAGLVIFGGVAPRVGERLIMDVEQIGPTAVSLRLHGIARYVGVPDDQGRMTIGLELSFEGPQEIRTAKFLFADL